MANLITDNNKKVILLGNEAIVRGALEAGAQFISTYPGTPSSEIGNNFFKLSKAAGVYFEFSTNEKTAMEAAIGASYSGLKCLVAMKNFGLNVAMDSFLPFIYTGVGDKGACVIVVADDPSCHSSAETEENTRAFAQLAHIPILEPSDAQECLDFIKLGFEISQEHHIPVMVRTTTRVAHQRSIVQLGNFTKPQSIVGEFISNKHSFVTLPPRVMQMHQELLNKIEAIRNFAETSKVNKIDLVSETDNSKKIGIITSGVSYLHSVEAIDELGLNIPILKLGMFYPLATEKIKAFIKPLKKVLIVEELDPYLEKEIAIIAREVSPRVKIFGKNVLTEIGELSPSDIIKAVTTLNGKKPKVEKMIEAPQIKHLPRFCTTPACPYWRLFAGVKQALGDNPKAVFGGDIGCYMIAGLPPTNLYDYVLSMGSSIGIAHGIAKATNGQSKAIAFMGDGTFLHSGVHALMNAVYNKSNILLMIADNRITAMTGHQPNPGMGQTSCGDPIEAIQIEAIAKACGVKNVATVDPVNNFDEFVSVVKELSSKSEPAVIVARHICALLEKKQSKA